MRKYIFFVAFAAVIISALSFNGCILDAFKTITQNIPIFQSFNVSGNATTYTQSEVIDLDSSTVYQRYKDQIQTIKLVRAEYRTTSINQPTLSGTVQITVSDMNNNVIFSVSLNNIKPADYEDTPFELSLDQSQITTFNNYLSNLSNKTFKVTINVTNISPTPYQFTGVVDMVFELTANT